MTRCCQFYRKCEKDGYDWCGKDHRTLQQIKDYIGLLKKLEELDIPWEAAIAQIPEGQARLIFDKRNCDIREKVIASIAESLKSHRNPLNGRLLKKWTSNIVNQLIMKLRRENRSENTLEIKELFSQEIFECDIEGASAHVQPDSVDLILTDPPYAEQFLDCWDKLRDFAFNVLKDGGVLISYSGKAHLPEVLKKLTDNTKLTYMWTGVLFNNGQDAAFDPLHFNTAWKPLIFFVKGKYIPKTEWFEDVIPGNGAEKDLHNWAQALGESERLIEYFTKPGDLVVDPFLGSGTTALAAKALNRRFLGMDKDPACIKTARGRLSLNA